MSADRLAQVLQRIDQLNRDDPNQERVGGQPQPRELVYSQWLTDWVLRLDPRASEALRIAARGQHVRRWTIPRERYERTRKGYLRWRETLKAFHIEQVRGLMAEAGYPPELIERVVRIMGKRHLQEEPESQTLEDALCLVFLERQFEDLRRKTPEATMLDVLRKTWGKMSERARAAALQVSLPPESKRFLLDAVSEGTGGIIGEGKR